MNKGKEFIIPHHTLEVLGSSFWSIGSSLSSVCVCRSERWHREPGTFHLVGWVLSLSTGSCSESKEILTPDTDPLFLTLCILQQCTRLVSCTGVSSLVTTFYLLVLTFGRIIPGVDDAALRDNLLRDFQLGSWQRQWFVPAVRLSGEAYGENALVTLYDNVCLQYSAKRAHLQALGTASRQTK